MSDNKKCCIFRKILRLCKKPKDVVAVVRLSGVIHEGGTFKRGLSISAVEEDLEKAFELSDLKAVALVINSPGGSPVQSEFIFRRIRDLSEEKNVPVYSFVEDVAASGGYWLACAGDEIYASQNSIVGSIGVITSFFGFVDAMKKVGVERRTYTQGENKSILDPFKEENPKDVEILYTLQKEIHESFKSLVRSRRGGKLKTSEEQRIFSGEFWTGTSGIALGLVDELGEMRSVMRKKFGKDIKLEKITKPKSWLRRKLGGAGAELVDGISDAITEKTLWSRYGL